MCGNKTEVTERQVSPDQIAEIYGDVQYYDLCVKDGHNIREPFDWLAQECLRVRQMTKENTSSCHVDEELILQATNFASDWLNSMTSASI